MAVKSFVPEFKAVGDDGSASWVMARLNVKDSDDDVTLPGAFGSQTFSIVPAHDSRHVPLGKATVTEEGDEAVVHAKFNLAIPAAKDWHSAIKFDLENPPAVQEYSYGYRLNEGGWKMGEFQGEQVRFLTPKADGSHGIDVYESSPVLRGAGVGTRTLAAKSGLQFSEHIEAVMADLDVLLVRAGEVKALREAKGKRISEASADLLADLDGAVKRLQHLLAEPAPDTSLDDFRREYARFVSISQGVLTT